MVPKHTGVRMSVEYQTSNQLYHGYTPTGMSEYATLSIEHLFYFHSVEGWTPTAPAPKRGVVHAYHEEDGKLHPKQQLAQDGR